MRTEFAIHGADCPVCLNQTLSSLRALPGIRRVEASSTQGCLVIDHGDLSIPALLARLHTGLHGTAMASNELVMTEVMPTIAITRCPHTAPDGAGTEPASAHPGPSADESRRR